MKRKKLNPEDLVTEHIVVTEKVFNLLWTLRVMWKYQRLSDVILRLIEGDMQACELR